MPGALDASKLFTVTTDIERLYGIVCPITGTLTPDDGVPRPWLSWTDPDAISTNVGTLSETIANIVMPTDIGSHLFTINIDSANYPGDVVNVNYPLQVNIECFVT